MSYPVKEQQEEGRRKETNTQLLLLPFPACTRKGTVATAAAFQTSRGQHLVTRAELPPAEVG